MIAFGGEYSKAQWSRGIRLAMYPRGWGLLLRLLAFGLFVGGLLILGVSYLQGEELRTTKLLRVALSLLVLAAWAALPFWNAWRAATQPWRNRRGGPSLNGVVTSEGIKSSATGAGTVDKWDTFLRAYLRDDTVVLVGSDGLATVLPREFFVTEDDWRGFRQLVEFNVVSPN